MTKIVAGLIHEALTIAIDIVGDLIEKGAADGNIEDLKKLVKAREYVEAEYQKK